MIIGHGGNDSGAMGTMSHRIGSRTVFGRKVRAEVFMPALDTGIQDGYFYPFFYSLPVTDQMMVDIFIAQGIKSPLMLHQGIIGQGIPCRGLIIILRFDRMNLNNIIELTIFYHTVALQPNQNLLLPGGVMVRTIAHEEIVQRCSFYFGMKIGRASCRE